MKVKVLAFQARTEDAERNSRISESHASESDQQVAALTDENLKLQLAATSSAALNGDISLQLATSLDQDARTNGWLLLHAALERVAFAIAGPIETKLDSSQSFVSQYWHFQLESEWLNSASTSLAFDAQFRLSLIKILDFTNSNRVSIAHPAPLYSVFDLLDFATKISKSSNSSSAQVRKSLQIAQLLKQIFEQSANWPNCNHLLSFNNVTLESFTPP
jgi:hypothetical protein